MWISIALASFPTAWLVGEGDEVLMVAGASRLGHSAPGGCSSSSFTLSPTATSCSNFAAARAEETASPLMLSTMAPRTIVPERAATLPGVIVTTTTRP